MKPWSVLLALFAFSVVVPSSSAYQVSSDRRPTVPSRVRQSIIRHYPGMAYIPGRLPRGFRYGGWDHWKTKKIFGFQINYFNGPLSSATIQINFAVGRGCPGGGSPMATYHINRRTISWGGTYGDQQAWLCKKTAQGGRFAISGLGSTPGDSPLTTPRARADARRLAYLVAYAVHAN